jgi:hypothetical protein
MALEQTLERIEHDIRRGDLGKARDRLHGLIVSYPDNLDLRKQLGGVYWRLQLPEMAGRYWYLIEEKDQNMLSACKRFEAQFGNDPAKILFAIKFKGSLETIKDTYAGRLLLDLQRQAKKKHGWYENFQTRGAEKHHQHKYGTGENKITGFIVKWGCITIMVVLVLLFLAGVIGGINSLLRLFA